MFYKIQSTENWDTVIFSSLLCLILSENDLLAIQIAHLDLPLISLFVITISSFGLYYQYAFCSLNSKSTFVFTIWENYFWFLLVIGFKTLTLQKYKQYIMIFGLLFCLLMLMSQFFCYLFSFYKLSSKFFLSFLHIVYHSFLYCW